MDKCVLCDNKIPKHLGIYLGDKLYCCQSHAEKHFIGTTYCERKEYKKC